MIAYEVKFDTQGDIADCVEWLERNNFKYHCPALFPCDNMQSAVGCHFKITMYDKNEAATFKLFYSNSIIQEEVREI